MIKYQSKKLQQKYQNDATFRKKMDEEEERYQRLLEQANQDLSQNSLYKDVLQQYPYEQDCELYFWYGNLQPVPDKQTTELALLFLQSFRPKHDKPFIFVYFNNGTPSSDYFFEFKNIFLLLPLSIIEKMKNFIVVKASKYIKVMSLVDSVGGNLLSQSYLILKDCKQLCQKLILNVKQFVQFVPEGISAEFPQTIKRKQNLSNYRMNVKGQTCTLQQKQQKIQFQRSISSFLQKQIYSIQQFHLSQLGIPMILQVLITYFQNNPEGLQAEGIFRKSVSVDEQDQLLSHLKRSDYQCLKDIKNPYMIASLIKKFFYNLKQPVIPYPHYNMLLADPTLNNIKAVINTLATVNYLSLLFLLQFLSKEVIKYQDKNKMNAYNLAVCFSQALMRNQVASESSIKNAKTTVNIAHEMINNLQFICSDVNKLFCRHLVEKDKKFESNLISKLQRHVNRKSSVKQTSYNLGSNLSVIRQNQKKLQRPSQRIGLITQSKILLPLLQNNKKLETSHLTQKMVQFSSQLRSIEDRNKNRKKSQAIQQKQYKSLIFEDNQQLNKQSEDTELYNCRMSINFDYSPNNNTAFNNQKKQ